MRAAVKSISLYLPQFLNHMHSTTGMPWWASIPIATLALRAALLPLSLRAKVRSKCDSCFCSKFTLLILQFLMELRQAASANFILINEAISKARSVRDGIIAAEKVHIMAAEAATKSEDERTASQLSNVPSKRARLPSGMGMWSLARGVYQHSKLHTQAPSLRWYTINAIIQVLTINSEFFSKT